MSSSAARVEPRRHGTFLGERWPGGRPDGALELFQQRDEIGTEQAIECDEVWRDGTTHVVFEPLDFITRLAALVPKPRVNLARFHGVFAPDSRYRAFMPFGYA